MKKITLFLFLLSLVTTVTVEAQITTFPYTEDFESGDGGWVADNSTNGTWALGTPDGAIINSAASGSNAWVTNLSGTYNTGENSWVTSPVFDFSSLAAPSIELSIWYDAENSYDGAVLQSSIDGGSTWNNVGANGDPNNWYNDGSIGGNPGGQQEGWTGTATDGTNAWVIARHALTGLAGESNVILRIAFGSDGSVIDDGFGFDDINIFEVLCPEPTDIVLANITETTGDISWNPGGSETLWDLEWGISGFTPGSGTLEAGLTTTSFNFIGLDLGTIYDVYIISNCESLGTSSLVGPITFNTQTPGGSCASALPMTVEADCDSATPTTFDFSIAEDLVESGNNPSCDAFANYGYWVSFTAPTIGSVVINFDGEASSIGLQVFDSCGGTEVSECNNNFLNAGDNSGVIGGLTPGETYYAIIWSDAQSGSADVCIEEGPTCPFPINLEATNLTESTADLGWSENGTATSWNIEWGPVGFTPGSGVMIENVTTNPYNLSGLEQNTEYDFYVQAICTSETSDFAGPLTFLTTPQTDFSIDCTAGPFTQDYCYDNNDTNIFTFTSLDGTPLNLTFNFGDIESCCDDLLVFDTNGDSLYADNNGGDLSGLTFQSSGDTISFQIDSDSSVSCASGSSDGINYTVSCATCVNPEATFEVVSDCFNGPQFFVEVDLTDLGSATSMTLSDNQGSADQTVSTPDVYTFGPYPNLTDVIITAANVDDVNCTLISNSLTQEICTETYIDCVNDGPLTLDYCYSSNDTNILTYTSIDGTPLNLTFNSGFVENFWDELVVLDSDGEPFEGYAPEDNNYGNAGDVSGITLQSTGDTISFYINSDGIFSCDEGSSPMGGGINYTVSCATCVNPEVAFDVVSDCINGPQFFVEVDLTDLGSATTMTLSDNQGSADQNVSTPDLYTFGPYPNLTDVVITVANDDDINCTTISSSLTQEFCVETYIDCATDGPLTLDTCYDDGGATTPTILTYTSVDGTPLNLTFNSGYVENGWDELVVLDSDGEPFDGYAPGDDNYGNAGNIAGLTFQSTGDTISFYVSSDGVFSCAGGNSPMDGGINYTVSCATCINPQATFTVIDDCDNGEQFLVDITIDSLGDATSLTITNNIDGDAIPVTEAGGTYQMGPFPFLQDVVISVSNDQDINCVINSQTYQLLACPPENDNCDGAITAVVNTNANCESTTPGTILAATPSGVPAGSCPGNPDDDVWFEFTALNEVQIISLLNITGGIFDLSHGLYEGECGNLTEIYCSGDETAVTPDLIVGNTYYVRVFSGGSDPETSTFDLCIRPAPTNTVCDNAENFCALGGALTTPNIVGIPSTGPVACLGSIPNPTWNIIQVGESGPIDIQIEQTNDAGVGLDVDFVIWGPFDSVEDGCTDILLEDCPTCPFSNVPDTGFYPFGNIVDCSYSGASIENLSIPNAIEGEIYLLLVTNFNGGAGNITIDQTNIDDTDNGTIEAEITAEITSDDVLLVDTDNPLIQEASVCGYDSVTLIADSPFADEFVWYRDGFIIEGETSSTLVVTESDNYYVTATDNQCGSSADSQYIIINLYNEAPSVEPQEINLCDESGEGVGTYDLDALTTSIGLGEDFVLSYYTNTNDAYQAINAVTSPYESAGETLIIRIEDANAAADGYLGCPALTQVELILNATPVINQPEPLRVCDDLDGAIDGLTEFNLNSISTEVTTDTSLTVTYYTSEENANTATNALVSPYESEGQTIFIRVEDTATGCYETTSFDIEVNLPPLATFDEEQYSYIVCPEATVPITIGISPENFTASDVSVSWELDGVSIPGSGLTLDTVLLPGDYTAIIEFNDSGCTNEITKTVEEAESCIFPEGISPGVSPGQNDYFDLSSFNVTKLEIFNRYGTLVYSKDNYTNEWEGQTNDGEELPVGTYFYTVVYEGGTKSKSAWVYINR
ncbi:T9SS type B sorting domain-containing protein [Winogradskyella vidalii]|uniref:T9SS type B sorting domain-containing protein n=1 Tax=Winogradskyella vidalii TaxID=2615024 RepID=UPI0015CA60E4|nr:gliding motility-associated C-terminal domain-containing protein [Winogradskyella vidalii]